MRVPFLDLRVTDNTQRQELLSAIDKVLEHGRLVIGPEVYELEKKISQYCSRRYAAGVSSGSDALFIALKSLGIGPGDEVITTALSWIATANAIALTGAAPVFADISDDLNINPDSAKGLITPHTKAIMPVHYTGKICKMDEIMQLAHEHKLYVVEDAAQAFGAVYKDRKAGSFGVAACFSMNPMKIFGALGDAGMILTDNKDIYNRLISLRYNGTVNREECVEVSLNARLDTLQAAVLLIRFKYIESIINARREIASWYDELLNGYVRIPKQEAGQRDVYYTYTIRADNRDELKAFLESKGVETKIQHPILMPEQPAYRESATGSYPNAMRLVNEILCLPANEKLGRADIQYVAACIREFYG